MLESELVNEEIARDRLALAPRSAGVYLFKDASGDVIYVGKAANLRSRVGSYFGGKTGLSTKVLRLVAVSEDIEYILCSTEQEALVLEADLIRRYKPHFNARLKDDKSFPYLEIDLGSEWPTVSVTRRRVNSDSQYFGPFASAHQMHQTLRLIRKAFPLRICRGPLPGDRRRACLNADIGLCPAPCVRAVDRGSYMRTARRVVLFLQGRHNEILRSLEREMQQASARLDFELAAELRDRFRAVQTVTHRYESVSALRGDQDILAVAQDGAVALVDVFSVREGRAVGRQTFPVEDANESLPGNVLRGFILGYYGAAASVPPVLLLQHPVEDSRLIAAWLTELRGGQVRMVAPRSGVRKQLVDNVADGVARQLAGIRAVGARGTPSRESGLKELRQVLGLPALPRRIEGYDISTIQGHEAVGSMVVFVDGVPKPSEYRCFRIRDVGGQDDFAMLAEVLRRRLSRLRSTSTADSRRTSGWTLQPSLILVDGGRGQLGAAVAARAGVPCREVPIVSLAKEHEEVFVEGSTAPAAMDRGSPGLLLLQAVRDEAHRFAVGYHRRLHGISQFKSSLDGLPGLGPKRKRALLVAYESIEALRSAQPEAIAAACSIPLAVAQRLKQHLAGQPG